MSEFYRKTSDETLESLGATRTGLSDSDVNQRREKYGYNELAEGKRKSTFQVFMEQFKDFLVIILIVAAVISAFLGEIESTIVILVVIILNAILGTVQHVKAEQSSITGADRRSASARPHSKPSLSLGGRSGGRERGVEGLTIRRLAPGPARSVDHRRL